MLDVEFSFESENGGRIDTKENREREEGGGEKRGEWLASSSCTGYSDADTRAVRHTGRVAHVSTP